MEDRENLLKMLSRSQIKVKIGMGKSKVLLFFLLSLTIILFSIFIVKYVKNIYEERKYWEGLVREKPFLLLAPSKFVKENIKEIEGFENYEFKNISIKLPMDLEKHKIKDKTILFKDRDVLVLFSITNGKVVPEDLKNKYKTTFDFFKDVLFSTENSKLLAYKNVLIPCVGEEIEINEFRIGENRGFLYKNVQGNNINNYYDIFFDNKGKVSLNIRGKKGSGLTEEEMDYIVSSLVWRERGHPWR